jgi:PAS domain S-box-containing protein
MTQAAPRNEAELDDPAGSNGSHAMRRAVLLTGVAVALLVVIAAIALVVVSRDLSAAHDARDDVEHVRETLQQLQLVLSTLQDAETGERGYVITGRPDFLEPYYSANRSLAAHLDQLRAMVADAEARAMLEQLKATASRQLAFLKTVIDIRSQKGQLAASDVAKQESGKRGMDEIRALVLRLQAKEEARLAQRRALVRQNSRRTEVLVQVSLVAATLLVLLAGALLLRHLRHRQAAERAANSAVMLLSSTMENLTQGVAVFNRQQALIAWNARYLELRGLSPQDVRAYMPLSEIRQLAASVNVTTDEGVRDSKQMTVSAMDTKQNFDGEVSRADGLVMQVRGRATPGDNYIVTYTDVTAIKLSEVAYRDQATRLASILDNVVDAIVTINESGSIESWSKGAERLFGYQANEVMRRNIKMLMPDPHASAHDGYIRRYIQTGERRIMGTSREVEAKRKDGQVVPVELGISEMRIGSRRLFIGVVRDISARLEVERLKTGFVSTVSHELRTPLTSISGSLGLLAGGVAGQLPAKATRLIDIAKLNCERLVRLINDILDLEKAESGKLDFRLEPLRLKPIVQQAIDLNRAFAHNYGAIIELDPHSADPTVYVDRDRVIQILTNLLSNAAKFSPRGGVIDLSIKADEDSVRVSVRDHGSGIAEQFQTRIFQKFAQADSSDSRAKGGTGLGLSIAKTIIERLGGSIGFDSEPGQGTTFYITLPLRHEPTAVPLSATGMFHGPSVLICEDDPDVAKILIEILRQEGMRAEAVPSARAARAALDAVRFDLAIVDLHLPDIDGLEFITELRSRANTRSLPVIVVTARSRGDSDAAVVSTLQLADWLQKPIDPRRLLETIQNVLVKPRDRPACILHVEDDESLTELVKELLGAEASVVAAHSLAQARRCLAERLYDLVILDLTLGDGSGLDLLPLLRDTENRPPVILYSATEPTREISGLVEAALVKSRDSVEQLLTSIRTLARREA